MTPFLKSRRNRIIIVILTFFLIAFLLKTTLDFILYKSKPKIVKNLSETFGYTFTLNSISFNFPIGLHLKELSIFYPNHDKASIYLKDVFISIKILPIFLKKIVISKININESICLSKMEEKGVNLQIIFSDIYKKIFKTNPMAFKIYFNNLYISCRLSRLIYVDDLCLPRGIYLFFNNACVLMHRSGRIEFKSDIKFTYQIPQENYISRFLYDKDIIQNFQCTMQGSINNKDINIDMLLLTLGKEQIVGLGLIKDFAERNPYIDIAFIPSNVSVNNITFLKNNFNPQGYLLIALRFTGPLDNIKSIISGHIDNCNFRYHLSDGEIFDIENISGKIQYKDEMINLENIYLKFNNLPLNMTLKTNISKEPSVSLSIFLLKDFLSFQNLPIEKLEAMFTGKIKKTLIGDLNIKTLYKRKGLHFEMEARFNNIDFDYYNLKEKYFKAERIELIKNNISYIQKLNFINFNSKVNLNKNRLNIKEVNFMGYGGILRGEVDIDLTGKALLKIILNGQQLDAKTLIEDLHITDKLLSGKLDTKIVFNNHSKDFLKGTCYIKDGVIDLDALAENVKFPPLKNVNFDIMHIYFAISKDLIKIRGLKLSNQDIMLNAYGDTNNRVNGALNVKIRSELLKESVQFKKLLDLTRVKKPYIDFRFLIGGVPKGSMRFMWMRDEFKEKIELVLPRGVKKSIEANLDKMVEDLANR